MTIMRKRRQLAPYLLILPTVIYLALFFAWPMVQAMMLAVWDGDGLLRLRESADSSSSLAGGLPQGKPVTIQERQANFVRTQDLDSTRSLTETWFKVSGLDAQENEVSGWTSDSRVRVREQTEEGIPVTGTVRRKLVSSAAPETELFAEPGGRSAVVGKLEPNAVVQIEEKALLEVWYRIEGEVNGEVVSGWAPSRFIQVFGDGTNGRINRGNAGLITREYIDKMVNDRFFIPALRNTLLLLVIILPLQFILAIVMALVIQSRLRGSAILLYIFAIPLGVSDLAVGIVWYAIFTQSGFLNTILQGLGLISASQVFLSTSTRHWILTAIVLAEVWRATSIVMVIVVSGLQAISQEVLEAAEVYGATYWQRVRNVILPLLRPSLQVALILRTILALQVFAVVIALSGGDFVTVLANETYRQYYDFRNSNVAAAYAGFILMLSMISAVVYLRIVRTQEEAVAS